MNTINWKNAIMAGFAGTLLLDFFGFILSGQWWDIPNILGEKTGLGLGYGVLAHYANGMLLAVLYAGIAPSLWGPAWIRPFIFITVQTITLVWLFMLPLLGAGIAAHKMGPMAALLSIVRHWIFAVPFVFLINKDIFTQKKLARTLTI